MKKNSQDQSLDSPSFWWTTRRFVFVPTPGLVSRTPASRAKELRSSKDRWAVIISPWLVVSYKGFLDRGHEMGPILGGIKLDAKVLWF